MIRLYHKDVYFPDFDFNAFWRRVREIRATEHFRDRQYTKGIPFPNMDDLKKSIIFEVATEYGHIVKIGCRVKTPYVDYCYIISDSGAIITAWVQSPEDDHKTLDASKYVQR